MVEGSIFIGAIVIAVTEFVKRVTPSQVGGAWIIPVAGVIGACVAGVAPHIGVSPISIAQGVLVGLAAAGVHTTVSTISSGK